MNREEELTLRNYVRQIRCRGTESNNALAGGASRDDKSVAVRYQLGDPKALIDTPCVGDRSCEGYLTGGQDGGAGERKLVRHYYHESLEIICKPRRGKTHLGN